MAARQTFIINAAATVLCHFHEGLKLRAILLIVIICLTLSFRRGLINAVYMKTLVYHGTMRCSGKMMPLKSSQPTVAHLSFERMVFCKSTRMLDTQFSNSQIAPKLAGRPGYMSIRRSCNWVYLTLWKGSSQRIWYVAGHIHATLVLVILIMIIGVQLHNVQLPDEYDQMLNHSGEWTQMISSDLSLSEGHLWQIWRG